jgi:hypothetical protein
MTCHEPIDFETLVGYWLGDATVERETALEEHLFGCAQCTARLEELAALAAGVRAAVENGRVTLVVSAPFVAAMRAAGLRLRDYRLGPGGSVNCTIAGDDDAVISHLRAPLAGVRRLDLVRSRDGAPSEARVADVPFDPATGEVLVVPSAAWLKTMPAFTMRMRLIAVDEKGEEQIGEYTFNHSPSADHSIT